jgi:hypothetical protein
VQERLNSLRDALTLLASPPGFQVDRLKALGIPEGIDELALEYDDIAAAADSMFEGGEITTQQRDCVKKLSVFLSEFGGQDNAHLWTPGALYSAPQWEQVRRMATDCLTRLR